MNGLDLFSGIGGISIALSKWVKTVAYCEQNRYAQAVLLSKMQSGELDRAPIWDDVRTLRSNMLPKIDIIFGGFPCQDISVAGKGAGLSGDRSGLFFEIIRLVDECNPAFVFLENVPAIRTRGLQTVAESFAVRGYNLMWTVLSAAEVGAPHLRKRWFALAAHPDRFRELQPSGSLKKLGNGFGELCEEMADTNCDGWKKQHVTAESKIQRRASWGVDPLRGAAWWATEPSVGRVANGVPARVDRIKCLGNAVVPFQAEKAFECLMKRWEKLRG